MSSDEEEASHVIVVKGIQSIISIVNSAPETTIQILDQEKKKWLSKSKMI